MVVGFVVIRVVLRLVLFHGIVVANLLARVEASTVVMGVLEVLRNRTLVSGVSNSTAMAAIFVVIIVVSTWIGC